jgi:Cytochrome c7 and related cytochrome c
LKNLLLVILAFISFNANAVDNCSAFAPFHSAGIFQQGKHFTCSCDSCHKGGVFKGTPSSCKACHVAGGRAQTSASASHIPTNGLECSSCHTPTSWVPGNMQHSQVTALSCETCHNGAFRAYGAMGKHKEHIPTSLTCSTCHKSTRNWDADFSHQGVVAGSCSTCHNGTYAKGKNIGHVPTALSCDTCHTGYSTFTGATMNHLGIVDGCETCHNGIMATGKTATHPSTPSSCITCHTVGNNWICKTGKLELYIRHIYAQLLEVFA